MRKAEGRRGLGACGVRGKSGVGDKMTFESVKGGGRWSRKFGVWNLKEAIGIVEMQVAQGAHTEDMGDLESRA